MAKTLKQREFLIRATRYVRLTISYTQISDFSLIVVATTEGAAIRKFRRMPDHGKRTVSIKSCRAFTSDPFDVIHLFDDGTGQMVLE